jgi:hypothetical protein
MPVPPKNKQKVFYGPNQTHNWDSTQGHHFMTFPFKEVKEI